MSSMYIPVATVVVALAVLPVHTQSSAQEKAKAEQYLGLLQAKETVDLRARVSGYLTKVHFKEGDHVEVNQLLFEIDPRPYEADLKRAQAGYTVRQARREVHENKVKLYKPLVDKGTVSREELIKATQDLIEAEASLEAAKAEVEAARLQLDYTKIRAPISGRIGQCRLTSGNLVKADDVSKSGSLATIVSTEPMHVYFEIDERTALRMMRHAKEQKIGVLAVAMQLADEKDFPRKGKIDFVDNQVNPKTGTLRVRAVFSNADGLLMPGMSVRVRVVP